MAALLFVAKAARAWREQERAAERRRGSGRRGWRRVGLQRRYSEAVHSSRGREQWRARQNHGEGRRPCFGQRREEEDEGRAGFAIMEKFRGLTEKQNFLLI